MRRDEMRTIVAHIYRLLAADLRPTAVQEDAVLRNKITDWIIDTLKYLQSATAGSFLSMLPAETQKGPDRTYVFVHCSHASSVTHVKHTQGFCTHVLYYTTCSCCQTGYPGLHNSDVDASCVWR